jgi:hypothetical protein
MEPIAKAPMKGATGAVDLANTATNGHGAR